MGDLLSPTPRQITTAPSSLPAVLIATVATLFVAYLSKQLCFSLGLGDSFYCFSDYGGIYLDRQLAGGRFPYDPPALEYPTGLGLIIWFASTVTSSGLGFVRANMVFASLATFAIVWILWRHGDRRAMFFAAAPTLVLYAFLNWDLVALVFAVAGLVAFLRGRDVTAGVCLGAGAAIKVFPGLLVLPILVQRWREGRRDAIVPIVLAAAAPLLLLNVPVMWAAFDGWAHFLRFNSARPVDWSTLWSVGCHVSGSALCGNVPLVNMLSLAAFIVGATAAWLLITRAAPEIPRWQLGLPIVVMFFLTNKVFSPQYSLWILPWFALALPNARLLLAYSMVDIGIYVTTFAWQQQLTGSGGLPLWPLNVFVVLRAVLLVLLLVALVRQAQAPVNRAA